MKNKIFLIALLLLSYRQSVDANVFDFETFLQQVTETDPRIEIVTENEKLVSELSPSGDKLLKTRLQSSVVHSVDQRPTQNPGFQGAETKAQSLSLGVGAQSIHGFKWSLTGNLSKVEIVGAAPTAIPMPSYYDLYPKIEFSVPLWRNFLGTETQAQVWQLSNVQKQSVLAAKIENLKVVVALENLFDEVWAGSELKQIRSDSLARAQKLYQWSRSRVVRGLADKSDVFQAEAAVKIRELELVQSNAEFESSKQKINRWRALPLDTKIEKIKERSTSGVVDGERVRLEYLLQKLATEIQQSQSTLQAQSELPQLDINAQYLLQGREATLSSAQERMLKDDKDLWALQLVFSMPIDYSTSRRDRDTLLKLSALQKKKGESTELDGREQWQQFKLNLKKIEEQLEIALKLERLQKDKVDSERTRFNLGRSTSFQVLSFEQDYINAQAQRISLQLAQKKYLSEARFFVNEKDVL